MKKRILKPFIALLLIAVLLFMPNLGITQTYAYENIGTSDVQGNCVDVSSNNGEVDFDSLAENGVERVVIRLGYGSDEYSQDDSQFYRNVAECERLGITYDLYIYSYALDYNDAISEADHALRLASECNPEFIWYDMEDADGYKRKKGLLPEQNGEKLTDFCIMFISAMRDNGYKTGIYANSNYFNNILDYDRLMATYGFNEWRAHWGRLEPPVECLMWQFGDFGLDTSFDGNIFYGDFETPITSADDVDYSEIYDREIGETADVYYQVKVGGRWLPNVRNNEDYAGIYGQPITDVAIKVSSGYAEYRVHSAGRWLGWIDTDNTDINDYYSGYAGNGQPIDAIQIIYHTPSGEVSKWAHYYTSSVEKTDGFYPSQWDADTDSGMDGYAGVFGRNMDALVITLEPRN